MQVAHSQAAWKHGLPGRPVELDPSGLLAKPEVAQQPSTNGSTKSEAAMNAASSIEISSPQWVCTPLPNGPHATTGPVEKDRV
jgi:hypothetical protein